MTRHPLTELAELGQSPWLDYLDRAFLASGDLARLVRDGCVRGLTSNPAIFEKAITGGNEYAALLDAPGMAGADAKTRYERLAIADIREAADILQPVYARTRHRDGYVSLEVSPYLARDTAGTLEEARRLWSAVGRPNVMIKVPATPEGIPAIRALIAEGVNVNVTLLFSQSAYEAVAEAYLAGLEALVARGGDPSRVASVASFFISRIDTAIDALIAERLAGGDAQAGLLQSIAGRVAIANAKLTYHRFNELFGGPRWAALAARGAQKQRVLWASTSTKNPQFRDTIYVEELIGPDTVNTIPPATFDAFRDHGRPRASLTEDLEGAQHTIDTLAAVGIPLAEVTARLLDDGLALFAQAFDRLLKENAGVNYGGTWLPDGRSLVFFSFLDQQLYHLDLATKKERRLTDEKNISAALNISPDGQWAVYQSTLSGNNDLRAVSLQGGPSRAVVSTPRDDYHPFISPTGRWLYFQLGHKNLYRVPGPAQQWRQAAPEQVTNFPEAEIFLEDFQISRDGRQLVYTRGRRGGDLWLLKLNQ